MNWDISLIKKMITEHDESDHWSLIEINNWNNKYYKSLLGSEIKHKCVNIIKSYNSDYDMGNHNNLQELRIKQHCTS